MDIDALEEYRIAKDASFASDPHSPIPEDDRPGFTGLSYFPPDPDLVFRVVPEPIVPEPVVIATTTGGERVYDRVADVEIPVAGATSRLSLYRSGHSGFFLPFRDATSGTETYGAGRYLDIEPNEDGSLTIDFNYAYHPFCAYSDAYSCALPPPGNWLTIPIRAGERLHA
jgi:uncharacterized protein (DUF1684 family)